MKILDNCAFMTASERISIVQGFLPLTFESLYGNDLSSIMTAQSVLADLTSVEPNIVLPAILQRAYSALNPQNVTSVHQAPAIMRGKS